MGNKISTSFIKKLEVLQNAFIENNNWNSKEEIPDIKVRPRGKSLKKKISKL